MLLLPSTNAFLIPPVIIVNAVNAIEIAKIILYTVFLSFMPSAIAEKPSRPPALNMAVIVEIIPTIPARPIHFTMAFSCEMSARPQVIFK